MANDLYLRKAEQLLRRATETKDLKDRAALIDEALRWHYKALAAMGKTGWAALPTEPDDQPN